MSITRFIPRSALLVYAVLRNAMDKAATYTDKAKMPLPLDVYDRLAEYLPMLSNEMRELDAAEVAQTGASIHKWPAFDRSVLFCSHFIICFNNGILRGEFPANHRGFYNLDVNSARVPVMKSETELKTVAENIRLGEAARVAAGGKPMSNPTAAEVETAFQAYFTLAQSQSTLKDNTAKEQKDISCILDEGILLVIDIYDELEHKFRHETDS